MRSRKNLPVLSVAATALPAVAATAPVIPQNYAHPGLSLMQMLSIVWAYRKHAIIIAATILVASAIFVKLLHKTYTATATLMVDYRQQDPLAAGQGGQSTPMGTYMSTEIQLMQSPEVVLPVIDKLKLTETRFIRRAIVATATTCASGSRRTSVKDIDIEPGQAGSQLIYVTAAARYPYLAALLANAISDIYLAQERNRVSGPASDRAKRYAAELAELKNKVADRAGPSHGISPAHRRDGCPGKNNNIQADLLASLEARLQDAQNARRAAEVRAATDPKSHDRRGGITRRCNR